MRPGMLARTRKSSARWPSLASTVQTQSPYVRNPAEVVHVQIAPGTIVSTFDSRVVLLSTKASAQRGTILSPPSVPWFFVCKIIPMLPICCFVVTNALPPTNPAPLLTSGYSLIRFHPRFFERGGEKKGEEEA